MSDNKLLDSINRYAVAGAANEDAYKGLRDTASHVFDTEVPQNRVPAFDLFTGEAETEFMELNYSQDDKAMHRKGSRAGQWKYRTYLPKGYSSAKSGLRKALGEGINPAGKGKTELEKERKALAPKKAVDSQDAAAKNWAEFLAHYDKLPDEVRAQWRRRIADTVGSMC